MLKNLFTRTVQLAEPFTTKTGAVITRYKQGGNVFSKVVYGSGDKFPQKVGIVSMERKIMQDGSSLCYFTLKSPEGEILPNCTVFPSWLRSFMNGELTREQLFFKAKIAQFFEGAINKL